MKFGPSKHLLLFNRRMLAQVPKYPVCRYRPEVEGPDKKALFKNRRGNKIHDWIIITAPEHRIRMSDNCGLLVPCCDLQN
jgi:hypothetical protein